MRTNRTKWLRFGVLALVVTLSGCWDEEEEPNDSFADAALGLHIEYPSVTKLLYGAETYTGPTIWSGLGRVDCLGDRRDVWIVHHLELKYLEPGRTVSVSPYKTSGDDRPWANMIGQGQLHVRVSTCASRCDDPASFRFLAEAYLDPALEDREPAVASFENTPGSQYMIEIETPPAEQCSAPYLIFVRRR
jgi:hypothetical protein